MNVYFPGLNGIRAIAALIVIFFHINVCMWFYGTSPIKYFEVRDEMSRHAVVLFFVLSGYLITYLLTKEKQTYKKIDVRKFYLRRILRIWPLYYLAIVLALLFIPLTQQLYSTTTSYSLQTIALYAVFVPNFALLAGYMIPTIAPLWSVGVEEQFYAFWPHLIKKTKNIMQVLVLFLTGCLAIKIALLLSGTQYSLFGIYFNYFSFDTLAIGGIAAYLYSKKSPLLNYVYHPVVEISCWLFFAASCILGPLNVHFLIDKEIYSVVFAIIILNVSTNPKAIINLDKGIFNYLGKISYGMYIYHPFIIVLTAFPLRQFIPSLNGKPLQLAIISIFVVPLTILVSKLSYTFFESRFLNIKKKFAKIHSTDEQASPEIPLVVIQPSTLGQKEVVHS